MTTDQIPQNKDAERGLLGSMLRENSITHSIFELVQKESFYFDAHQKVFEIIAESVTAGKSIDAVLLAEAVKQRGWVEDIGGYQYIADLWECAPTAANAMHYAGIVRDMALLRSLIHVCTEVLANAYNPTMSPEELVSDAQRQILEIGVDMRTSINHKLADVVVEAENELEIRMKNPNAIKGVASGLVDLDGMTGGFQKGQLVIIAARPSLGKTALAGNVCRNAAALGMSSLMISLEQSRVELANRWLAGDSKINSHALTTGRLSKDQVARLVDAGYHLKKLPIWINDSASQRTRNILSAARRLRAKEDIRFIVIDYLQLIMADDERVNRVEQVSRITRTLKLVARELEVPLIVLSQLSRKSEDREDKRPRLSDLRESGSIEQDADMVLFLHRPNPRIADEPNEQIELIVAKQRNGPCGEVPLMYHKATMRFENYAPGIPM